MTIRAALLDENGVYLRIDELAGAGVLTPRHLPTVMECDLPVGQYKWIADEKNPYGGAFWPIKWLERVEQDKLSVKEAQEAAQKMVEKRAHRRRERGEA